MKIDNNVVVFDDSEIRLTNICGVYVILRDLVFSLNDSHFKILRCQDDEEAMDKWNYVHRKLMFNPNFIKIDDMNVLVNISQLENIEEVYNERDKLFGVKLNYGKQEIGVWNSSKKVINKCRVDLTNGLLHVNTKNESVYGKEQ